MKTEYQPKTGLPCDCKPGIHRDNCPECEGTGQRVDFAKIRARRTETADKATARPWKIEVGRYPNGKLHGVPYVYAPNGPDTHRHVCQPFIDDSAPAEIQAMQEANAALIVRAVNSYDALCRVAEVARRVSNDWDDSYHELQNALAALDKEQSAAIAKAKGDK